jgi:ferritin-like protein
MDLAYVYIYPIYTYMQMYLKYFIYNLATNQVLQRFTANSDQEASNYRQAVSNDLNEPDLRVRRDLEDSRDLSQKSSRYILENFTDLQIATMLGGHTLE